MRQTKKQRKNNGIFSCAGIIRCYLFVHVFLLTTAISQCQFAMAEGVQNGPVVRPGDKELIAPVWGIDNTGRPDGSIAFTSLAVKLGGAKIQLSGGIAVVDLADWQAVAVSDNSNGNMCSLTLVGPRTVLIAAHCVDAKLAPGSKGQAALTATVKFSATENPYKMKCEISPEYLKWPSNDFGVPRTSEDYALCELDRLVKDIEYETLSLGENLRVGEIITLVGYGCENLAISEDETRYTYTDGRRILRIGERPINAMGVKLFAQRPAQYWRTLSSNSREPALCYGDSGGPVMYPVDGGGRRVIAVNSALGAVPTATYKKPAFYSYLSPLGTTEFKRFLQYWVNAGAAGTGSPRIVCGFNRDGGNQGCRQ